MPRADADAGAGLGYRLDVMSRASRIRFASQVLILQIGVVVLIGVAGYCRTAWVQRDELRNQYCRRALTLARAVAADPMIEDTVATGDPHGQVEQRAERYRTSTGALFVVVTDRRGIRLSHPNPDQIGRRVSTDPSAALSGHEVAKIERGTLGLSARGKVPLYHDGTIVGEVSVGFDADEIDQRVHHTLAVAALFASGTILLGAAASYGIGRRLKRQTLGLEPYEFAELVREREAVLHGIAEGVLAVDATGRVTACNAEAARLLGVTPSRGDPIAGLPVVGRLRAVLGGEETEVRNLFAVAGERVLVVNRREVRHDGRFLGAVITLRDRTDVESLARELDSVRTLFDALRAQRHEYAGRLHTLSGLLQLGHYEEAAGYIQTLAEVPAGREAPPGSVGDPYLRAFLAAKAAVAAEKGVTLEVADTSWVPGRVADPLDVTTVLGNLVDNAIEAARLGTRRPARVEVDLLGDGPDLHLTVADSGPGVPPELREAIFRDGVSTREPEAGRPRGLGLALARHAARARGGDITIAGDAAVPVEAAAAAQEPGDVFTAGAGAAGVGAVRASASPQAGAETAPAAPDTGTGRGDPLPDGPPETFGAVFVARLPEVLR